MKKLILTIAALAAFSVSQAQETQKYMVVNLSSGLTKTIPLDEVTNVEFQDLAPAITKKTFEVNGVKLVMRKVEKGSFYMQTMEEDASKKVTLTKDFWMAETVVTQELYKAVTGESLPSNWQPWMFNDRYPIELTVPQANAFISKLNELTGKKFRLPTEAEWEYAARGGKYHTPTLYAGSNEIFRVAWYKDNNELADNLIVALKGPNQLNLYDMSGLIGEWTSDVSWDFDVLPYGTDPANPNTGDYEKTFVVRGGRYTSPAEECTVLSRKNQQNPPSSYNFDTQTGVRLVLTAE